MDDPLFGFESYHILLAAIGASLLLSYWLPRLVFRRARRLRVVDGIGMLASALFPGIIANRPNLNPYVWEITAEIVVVVVLFSTGLRIDDIGGFRLWRPTIGLLAVTMPLTIAAVALFGWAMTGMTIAGAVLLGAVLAPTDRVLAGDVQVGRPSREASIRSASPSRRRQD